MKNDNYVDYQMNKIVKDIDGNSSKKLIVTGGKKSGKSESLRYYAKNFNNSNRCIIYVDYKEFNYKNALSEKEYQLYYELVFVKKMLDSIKNYNNNLHSNFKVFESYITNELNKFREFLMTRYYASDDIQFERGSLVKKMLDIFSIEGITNISLVIDHFDFVGESSERYQKFMEYYFDLFNKVIVTTNEDMNDEKIKHLKDKEFDIYKVDNGHDINYVKPILQAYLASIEHDVVYDVGYIVRLHNIYNLFKYNAFYEELIDKCNGNIDMMMQVIRYYITGDNLDSAIESTVRLQNEIDQLTYKRILHL